MLAQLRLIGNRLLKATAAQASKAELGHLHYQLAKVHDELTLYYEAAVHYEAAAHCLNAANQARSAAQAYLMLGEVQTHLGYFGVTETFEKALAIGDRLGDNPLRAQATLNLGRLKELSGELDGALEDYCKAERLLSQAGKPIENADLVSLRVDIVRSIASVKTERVIQQTIAIAQQVIQPPESGGLEAISPVITRTRGSGPRPWWPWPRRRR